MKRLLLAAALISTAARADEAAPSAEPETADVKKTEVTAAKPALFENWISLDEWASREKLKEGTFSAEVLLGYEYVNDQTFPSKTANALLTRTRLQYETANYAGFDGKIMGQYVGPINDHFGPRDGAYDTVADPEAFRLHEAYLAYTGYDTHARIGAQEIILDNARFIGNVGWRFNAQSFNAGLLKNDSIDNLTLLYAYTDSINATDGNINHTRQYHLFNGEYKLDDRTRASAFAYLQRNDAGADIDTFGARLWGSIDTLTHQTMIAFQRDAYYAYLSGALDIEGIGFEIGGEYLSGGTDSRDQFRTLNGTAHAFNGWADQFLNSAAGLPSGLMDIWFKGSVSPTERMDLIGVYHYFRTAFDASGYDGTYGNEIDAMLKYNVCKNFSALAGAAYYLKYGSDAANVRDDKTVFWLRGTFTF